MLPSKRTAGFALVELVVVLAVLLGVVFSPKLFNGDANRAKQSKETTHELVGAKDAQGAAAAASVTTMIEANATAPDSPEKEFIGLEGPVALSYLPKADPLALARSQARKAAILQGQRDEARRLYADERARADKADQRTLQAVAAKGRSDDELARVAAEREGAQTQRNLFFLLAVLLFVGWCYVKFTHLSPAAVAELRKDLGSVAPDAVQALDGVASRLQQALSRGIRKKQDRKAAVKAAVAAVDAAP